VRVFARRGSDFVESTRPEGIVSTKASLTDDFVGLTPPRRMHPTFSRRGRGSSGLRTPAPEPGGGVPDELGPGYSRQRFETGMFSEATGAYTFLQNTARCVLGV
jgi:hypothetical protein